MKGTEEDFSAGVRDSDGRWPNLPNTWSYSSLKQPTECPRRWMLSRATYPKIWDRWGYPPRPSLPTLVGDIVHGILEVLLRSFRDHGCTSLADPATVQVLKDLGGYTKLVEQRIEEELAQLADNPRVANRLAPLHTALRVKVPEIRQRVQAVIARTNFQPASDIPSGEGSPPGRGPLSLGFHPEVELRAADLRLAGRADLVTVEEDGCEITDYKTGAPDQHHADQLRLYALLWSRDADLNPRTLPVQRLVVSYPSHDVEIDSPTAAELDTLAVETAARIHDAEVALQERPPPACPEVTMCRMCSVRQLCSEYWTDLDRGLSDSGTGSNSDWFDFEGTVTSQNGARSWLVSTDTDHPSLLLRTSSETVPFQVGERIRLLNLHREADPESALPIGAMTHVSEVFALDAPS